MPDDLQPQTTLRDTLETNVAAAEAGTLPTIEEAAADVRARDEAGRFAPKPKEDAEVRVAQTAQPLVKEAPQAQPDPLATLRPTTWKKEYLPLWDKAASGQPLSPQEWKKLAEYNGQRENEYKTGVSTYKAEAQNAKELQEAITPFLPELQAVNKHPAQWIKELGTAHYALIKGTPELKLQVFRELARQYNVPLQAVMAQPGQVPPIVNELLGQIQELKQQVSGVTNWRQQQETTSLTSEIAKYAGDATNYPHFDVLRGTMAQLLESGLAPDIPTAYETAKWMVPETRDAEKLRLTQQGNQTNAVATAKARAVSPKSATPSGQVATTSGAKDRRAQIEEAVEASLGGRV